MNVLVLPFRRMPDGLEYAVFRRADRTEAHWQAVAGGVEVGETPLQAAQRELAEETGLGPARRWLPLDAHATVPARVFRDWRAWGPEVFVVRELAFGVEAAAGETVRLSGEHLAFEWLSYAQAHERLRWDSNRTALWELHTRLTEPPFIAAERPTFPPA
ncbi:NUDIX pyrophosphatase [Phenylobacterium sp.]|uniref:NUDIX hydrolase n=1 Tax=Phenylobacterium sp. TaxID=1871053 RepID=UPI0025D27EDD|nr:NUDIX pyrophosphatase [Phenylobacterium sp.]